MQSTRWQTVNRIFDEALLLSAEDRPAYVQAVTAGDEDLRREVEALLQADSNAGSFLDQPAIPSASSLAAALEPPFLPPGTVLGQRFEIRRFLAEGGMGSVYEAFDRELRTGVALKLVRPEIAAHPQSLDRFRREVALARRITHPGVCRTFDFERAQHQGSELLFLTMEMLAGETLRQRLATAGPLPLAEALAIASQVAGALAAAHNLGVIHRDIKPGNIMLGPADGSGAGFRAVVMDFGLALAQPRGTTSADHAVTQFGDLTQAGLPLGTLAYMAPEQIEGLAVSPATDTYALALVFIETLSGRRVFNSDNPLSGLAQRLRGSVPLEALLPTDAPPAWLSLLSRALSPDPQQRQDSPRELMDKLDDAAANRTALASPQHRTARTSHDRTASAGSLARRMPVLAAALCTATVAVVSLLWWGLRLFRAESNSAVTQGSTVYLAPLNNQTGLHSLETAGVLLDANLQQSVHMRLLEHSRVAQTLVTMTRPADGPIDAATAREIAMRTGAVRVVFPSIRKTGNTLTLDIDLEQPDQSPARARSRWTRSFPWTPNSPTGKQEAYALDPEMLAAVRLAGDWVRARTGESADDIARLDLPPEDATTANWEALAEYAFAEKEFAAGKRSEGITALERATSLDNQFAMAFAQLGDQLVSIGRLREGLAAYRQAIGTTDRQRLTRRELDRVRGMYAADTFDDATAEAQFSDLTAFYPNDWRAWFYREGPLLRMGRTAEAIECMKRAWKLHPEGVVAFHLGLDALVADDLQQARGWVKTLRDRGEIARAHMLEGQIDAVDGKLESAQENLVALAADGSPEHMFWSALLLSHLYANEGHYREAEQTLDEGRQQADARGEEGNKARLDMQHAALICAHGSPAECVPRLQAALAEEHSPEPLLLASAALESHVTRVTGTDPASKALLEQMRADLGENVPGPLFAIVRLQIDGARALARHRCAEALENFRAEDRLDNALGPRDYLSRAAESCAGSEPNPSRAASLRKQAADAYAGSAFHPGLAWFNASLQPPGSSAEELEGWLRVADPGDPRRPSTTNRLLSLRRTPDHSAAKVPSANP